MPQAKTVMGLYDHGQVFQENLTWYLIYPELLSQKL